VLFVLALFAAAGQLFYICMYKSARVSHIYALKWAENSLSLFLLTEISRSSRPFIGTDQKESDDFFLCAARMEFVPAASSRSSIIKGCGEF
jgi:hypothetical protein